MYSAGCAQASSSNDCACTSVRLSTIANDAEHPCQGVTGLLLILVRICLGTAGGPPVLAAQRLLSSMLFCKCSTVC